MPVTPLAPDTPDITTFGAPYQDYDVIVDPTTELGSGPMNRLIAQVVATGHTAPRAWVKVAVSGTVYTIADHDAVWGSTSGVRPTVTRTGLGVGTVTWAAAYADLQPLPETHTVTLRTASAQAAFHAGASAPPTSGAWVSSANVVTFGFCNAAVGAVFVDPDEFTIWVW